ncbi:MAG: 2-phosphosulfolactate phosphatase [Rikenellaceae bacterium]
MFIDIVLTPLEVDSERFKGKSVAVIDVFRATTCICTAMGNGAQRLIPLTSVEESREKYEELKGSVEKLLLGGEREMVRIEGFELDNSPLGYTREVVEGATIITSTTNGTRSIQLAEKGGASSVYIASLLNAAAAAERLHGEGKDIVLFCSGRRNRFSVEDTLCAGYIASLLDENHTVELSDVAWWAIDVYKRYKDNLREPMRHNSHYIRLVEMGLSDDVAAALKVDSMDIVPKVVRGEVIL